MRSRPSSEALARVEELLDCLPTPAFLVSPEHEILAHNDCFRDEFGGGRSAGGNRCHATIHRGAVPCHHRGELCPVRGCLESTIAVHAVHVHPTPRGPLRQYVSAFSVRNVSSLARMGLTVLHPSLRSVSPTARSWPVGRSRPFVRVMTRVRAAAVTDSPVLLLGESGTGKELLARTIHRLGARHHRPFVPLDASALRGLGTWDGLAAQDPPPVLAMPTSAVLLAELLGGGTLYLAEVGGLDPRSQSSLRALIDGWFAGLDRFVDDRRERARLICGSSSDLSAAVADGRFRRDLYHRIAAFSVRVPPLRERMEDLPDLVAALLAAKGESTGRALSADGLETLARLDYPGNIDQLDRILNDLSAGASG